MLVRIRLVHNVALGLLAFAIVLGLIFVVGMILVLNLYWIVAVLVYWGLLSVISRQGEEIDKLRHDLTQLERVIDEELERTKG